MKENKKNRIRIIGLRLTTDEYARIEKKWQATTCRKLSDYVRHCIFDKPIVTIYRNQSQDDLLTELSQLRTELNAIGNNLNQAVKKLHSIQGSGDMKRWIDQFDYTEKSLLRKLEEIKCGIQKIAEAWLQ